jgi:predicted DNA-binding transcriptional regulator AlpA
MAQVNLHTASEAARLLGWKEITLAKRRQFGLPPRFIKLGGRSVRYRLEDLEAFVESGLRTSTVG